MLTFKIWYVYYDWKNVDISIILWKYKKLIPKSLNTLNVIKEILYTDISIDGWIGRTIKERLYCKIISYSALVSYFILITYNNK